MKQVKTLIFSSIIFLFISTSCRHHSHPVISKVAINSEYFFENTMILNSKCDNTLEGNLLIIKKISGDSIFLNEIPKCIFNNDLSKWVIGWGMDIKFFDNGSENLAQIKLIDSANKIVIISKQIKGTKKPSLEQPVVFWNIQPSGFSNITKQPLTFLKEIPENWKNKSLLISKVVFDSLNQQYIMILNQVDSDTLAVYAMKSTNLTDWQPVNKGRIIYDAIDFGWKKFEQEEKNHYSSFLTDVIYFNGAWHYAFTTITKDDKRNISIYQSEQLLQKDVKLVSENIVNYKKHWKCCGAYLPKFARYKNHILLFYTGRNDQRFESISFMVTKDMKKWDDIRKRLYLGNKGWRSDLRCSEVAKAEVKSDTIFLYVQGAKLPNLGLWKRFITKTEYKYLPGNILDSEIGLFISVDGGMTFKASKKNPIFTNNYASSFEDDHLGISLDLFHRSDTTFLFYTAKAQNTGLYQPFLKIRIKK